MIDIKFKKQIQIATDGADDTQSDPAKEPNKNICRQRYDKPIH
jgi:hypothetical protein